jgi:hypothetical protein
MIFCMPLFFLKKILLENHLFDMERVIVCFSVKRSTIFSGNVNIIKRLYQFCRVIHYEYRVGVGVRYSFFFTSIRNYVQLLEHEKVRKK